MNLLFDFLKNLQENERLKLKSLFLKGRAKQVWEMLSKQASELKFDREKVETEIQISSAHFDKITSQLLSKCYEHLFDNDGLALLGFLSGRSSYAKHYYQEMKRQLSYAEANFSKKNLAVFYKTNISFIHFNMPIIHKDEDVLKMLAKKFLAVEKNKNAHLLIECKLLYVHIDKLFAAAKIAEQATVVAKKIESLGKLPADADSELTFAYYWLKIYYYNAIENFAWSAVVSKDAINDLKKFKDKANRMNLLRVELKLAELNYYLSNFEESFADFKRLLQTKEAKQNPDYNYITTKYFQVCLITNHLQEAEQIVEERKGFPHKQLRDVLLPRDIISFAKYYLFCGDYNQAFEYIQLGFEKNPKGKYFQYEIELRNLQTACFYLSGQKQLAVQMCKKHIKYLRNHGYGIKQSDFQYFYVLTKAMFDKSMRGKKISLKENEMLKRYQLGSYAVYGKLLLKMLER